MLVKDAHNLLHDCKDKEQLATLGVAGWVIERLRSGA